MRTSTVDFLRSYMACCQISVSSADILRSVVMDDILNSPVSIALGVCLHEMSDVAANISAITISVVLIFMVVFFCCYNIAQI